MLFFEMCAKRYGMLLMHHLLVIHIGVHLLGVHFYGVFCVAGGLNLFFVEVKFKLEIKLENSFLIENLEKI